MTGMPTITTPKMFDFTKPITSNTTVYAKWTAKDYEVSFVTEHGNAPTSQNVTYNGTAKDPGTLTAEGYTFIGWYTDHTCTTEFKFSTPITGDTKVYAKWEKNAPVLPDTYALNVSGAFVYVDGVDFTASAGDTSLHLEKNASVRLVADPDRMPSGMVFDRWTILNGALNADDAEKFETGRTLEEFAFTMPAEPLSIEATPRMQEEEGSDTASVILRRHTGHCRHRSGSLAGLRPGHEPLSGALAPGGFRHAQDPRRACPPAVEHGRPPRPCRTARLYGHPRPRHRAGRPVGRGNGPDDPQER